MIIVCPKCSKLYHVDPAELPAAKMADRKKKGRGWFLSCQYCFHEWWHSSPKGFTWYEGGEQTITYGKTVVPTPNRFDDLTNLDGLKHHDLTESEKKELYHQDVMRNSYSPFYDHPSFSQDNKGPTVVQEKIGTSLIYKMFVAFLAAIILMSMAFFFNLIHIEKTSSFITDAIKNTVPLNQKFIFKMQVNNVTHNVVADGDRKTIHVKGEIFNPSNIEEKLPNLKVSVWGVCPSETIASSLSSGEPYCLIKSWEYHFENPIINSNESVCFETSASIPCESNPLKVDVTF